MKKEFVQKLTLATKLLNMIIEFAGQGEDYSLLQRQYNEMITEYNLPLLKIRWISEIEFEFIKEENENGI